MNTPQNFQRSKARNNILLIWSHKVRGLKSFHDLEAYNFMITTVTPNHRIFLEQPTIIKLVKKFPDFVEYMGSSPYAQNPIFCSSIHFSKI